MRTTFLCRKCYRKQLCEVRARKGDGYETFLMRDIRERKGEKEPT